LGIGIQIIKNANIVDIKENLFGYIYKNVNIKSNYPSTISFEDKNTKTNIVYALIGTAAFLNNSCCSKNLGFSPIKKKEITDITNDEYKFQKFIKKNFTFKNKKNQIISNFFKISFKNGNINCNESELIFKKNKQLFIQYNKQLPFECGCHQCKNEKCNCSAQVKKEDEDEDEDENY
jgi:hypothetical protein